MANDAVETEASLEAEEKLQKLAALEVRCQQAENALNIARENQKAASKFYDTCVLELRSAVRRRDDLEFHFDRSTKEADGTGVTVVDEHHQLIAHQATYAPPAETLGALVPTNPGSTITPKKKRTSAGKGKKRGRQ
jgi:hypothetical protein